MPVLDFVLAELPAQLDELAVAKRREVDQPLERTLELDAHAVEAQHSLEQLLFGTLDSVLCLLLPLAVAAIRAGPLHRVLGHPQLLLEVGPQGGELGDLSHDRAHTRQLPVRFFHGVRAEPLHRSTILRSMDASAMRSRILEARVARLATADAEGRPHIVPISFALDGETMFFAVDAKPKRTTDLKRCRNSAPNPRVARGRPWPTSRPPPVSRARASIATSGPVKPCSRCWTWRLNPAHEPGSWARPSRWSATRD